MKFSQNRFYIESYTKCANCGVLIYEDSAEDQANQVMRDGEHYCSQWCVDWKDARDARKAKAGA